MNQYGYINQSTKFMQIPLVFTYLILFQESIQEVICILLMKIVWMDLSYSYLSS